MVTMSAAHERRKPETLSARALRSERARARKHARDSDAAQSERRTSEELLRIVDDERPRTRAECKNGPRPCSFVACRFHLYLEVNEATGSLKINFPDVEPWELPESCALDIAERGGLTLEEIGRLMNMTRERARQLEIGGLLKLKRGV